MEKKYSIKTVKNEAKLILEKNNITEINSNINFLLQYALNLNSAELFLKDYLTKKEYKHFINLVKKRAKHVPLQHITKTVDFANNILYVNKHVLIPRFETEELTNYAIEHINKLSYDNLNVLDLCCGSGCIGLGVLKNCKNINLTLADISKQALKVAKYNAKINNLSCNFIKSDMFKNIKEKYNVILCNPPYISVDEKSKLMPEVINHDPSIALFGGKTGLEFYEIIAKQCTEFLNKNGMLFLEYGENQENDIKNVLKTNFKCIKILKDYYGVNRFICAIKKD